MRARRPRLLPLTGMAAALCIVAHGVGAVTAETAPIATRLGVSIEADVAAQASVAARRSRTLDMREQAARAAEMRLKAGFAVREAAAAKAGAAVPAAPVGEQYDSLARVYQAMKPALAAPVFEQLDMSVQLEVVRRMRDRSTAMLMGAMSPKGAADLSMAVARKSAIPPTSVATPARTVTAEAAAAPSPGVREKTAAAAGGKQDVSAIPARTGS